MRIPFTTSLSALAVLLTMTACASTRATETEAVQPPSERPDAVTKTEAQWRASLSPEEFHVLREAGTERAFTGKYWDNHDDGAYHCAACGLELFDSKTKFESGTGWPSFYNAVGENHVATKVDSTLGMARTEILCARCGGHLGHVFPDGPEPTGLRYCVNGTALDFTPTKK